MKKITPEQLKSDLEHGSFKILDVRNEVKFQNDYLQHNHAKNINIFKEEIFKLETQNTGDINLPFTKDEKVIITCTTGNSASRCAKILSNKGYNVQLLANGMTGWKQFNGEA